MDDDTTPATDPDGEPDPEPAHAEGARLPLPTAGPPPPPTDGSDAAFVAWLRSLVAPDGTFRVPRLAVTDPFGNDCIVLQRRDFRSEVVVAIPSPPGESNEVTVYAENGNPTFPDMEPSLGAVITIGGNEAAAVTAVVDRWGGWELSYGEDKGSAIGGGPR